MAFNKVSWLAVAVMFEITVCSFALDIMHLKDEQQDDSSSIEKRSVKSGVCLLNRAVDSLGNIFVIDIMKSIFN